MERLKFSCGDSVCSSLERESSQVRSWVAEDFTAPREDTARASCGNGAKSDFLPITRRRKAELVIEGTSPTMKTTFAVDCIFLNSVWQAVFLRSSLTALLLAPLGALHAGRTLPGVPRFGILRAGFQ